MDTSNLAKLFNIQTPAQLDTSKPVLIVEDQQDMRLIITQHLNKLNFNAVIQASNGYEALETMTENREIALIISDLEMPVMGGIDLLQEIRENPKYSRGPFCLAMDNPSKEKLMLAVENGVDEVLVKPFTLNDIVPKLRTAFKVFHNPKNPEKVYELAKTLFRDNKMDQSEKVYKALSDASPKSARPIVGLARICMARGQFAKALELLSDAEKRNQHYVHVFAVRGEIYGQEGKWDAAITAFKKAIEMSPLNPVRYKLAADILFKVKKFQEAVDILNIALSHELNFKELQHYLSQGYFALKDYQKAIRYIRSALSQDEDNVIYLNQLGIAYKESNNFEEATKVYNKIIKLDPDNKAALYNKAIMLNSKGDSVEAIKNLERVIKKHPDFEQAKAKLQEIKSKAGGGQGAA